MSPTLDTIKRYASSLLLTSIVEHSDDTGARKPISESFPAAVLFADITGFTALTERLTKESSQGVEKLARILDLYIGKLVEIITSHGGDIVKFAGDALFAVWKAESQGRSLSLMTHRAVRCGMDIQNRLHEMKVDDDTILTLRVGLGAGRLHALYIGGLFDRWELLITGDPMNQVGQAGKIAQPGQVVISPRVSYYIKDIQGGDASNNGKFILKNLEETSEPQALPALDIKATIEETLCSYIPRAILARLEDGLDPWTADLRRMTVLFIKVRTFRYTPSTPVEDIQNLMRIMQKCIYEYEGSINRFGIDDKGAILLAAFGLPPLDHPDDPKLGLLAARCIRKELEAIGHESAIGIATGKAFCGSVGNNTRCEYTMHGTNVNLAARLMMNAETILCDGNTYDATRDEIQFEELDRIQVKGKEEPVKVYRPLED